MKKFFSLFALLLVCHIYFPTIGEAQNTMTLMKLESIWNDDDTLNQEAFDIMIKRLNALSPEDVTLWQNALKESTGEEISSQDLALFLITMNKLFDEENRFKKDESQKLVARMKLVPDKINIAWQQALISLSKENLGKAQTMVYLVQIDPLYSSNKFSEKASGKFMSRLKSLPAQVLIDWQKAVKRREKKSSTALELILLDQFFTNDTFQSNLFYKTANPKP